jgi:hypothetical protein
MNVYNGEKLMKSSFVPPNLEDRKPVDKIKKTSPYSTGTVMYLIEQREKSRQESARQSGCEEGAASSWR